MSGPKHTPTVLSGPCPSCEGRGYDYESGDWSMDQPVRVACPDCAGTGKAEDSITANEKLRDAAPRLAAANKRLLDNPAPIGAAIDYESVREQAEAHTRAVDFARAALREAGVTDDA